MYEAQDISSTVWCRVIPGIKRVAARCPDVDWTSMALLQELLERRTRLYLDDAHPRDFLIIRLDYNTRRHEIELFIRVAYSSAGDARALYREKLIKLAQYFGAARITMQSSRRGFRERPEWTPLSTLYALEVPREQ